jgi:type IV pilus assembly protein PilA
MIGNKMMGNNWLLGLILIGAVPFSAAADAPAPQTARQALLEMFLSPTPGTMEKHLPEVTRAAIKKAQTGSGASMLTSFGMMASAMQARGQQMQTFETGPTLVSFEDPQQHTKMEIVVERDDLQADEDQIEISVHASKDGETQTAGVKPHLTFTMKQEAGVWRLNDITIAVNVSLTDPALLKAMTTAPRPTISSDNPSQVQPVSNWGAVRAGNEASAASAMRTLMIAQTRYATLYPARGYTCSLSDLGGMGGSDQNEHQAMLIDPRLASGKKNDYRFAFSGCDGSPTSKFTVTAVPAESGMGMKTFCSDQSGMIRFSSDPNPASCVSTGKPLQ